MIAPRLTAICILVILASVLATAWALALAAEPDPERLAASCDDGRASSCVYLGVLYRHGKQGVPQDHEKALALQSKACSLGSRFGCGYTGEMLYLGLGAAENKTEGAKLMRTACAEGDRWSCDAMRRNGLRPAPEPAGPSES